MKMNLKKWGVPFLAVSLALTTIPSHPSLVEAEGSTSYQAKADVLKTLTASMMPLPDKGSDLLEENFSHEDVNFYDIQISSSEIVLKGEVTIQSENVPFSLKGELYKHQIAGILVGDLHDELGNFNVDRFEIENSANKAGVFLNQSLNDEVFALYMTHNDSKEFLMIEDAASELTSEENLSNIFNEDLKLASNELISWFTIFNPDETEIEEVAENESIGTRATSKTKTTTWSLKTAYTLGLSAAYTDTSAVKLFIDFPLDTNSSLNTRFQIIGTKMRWYSGNREGIMYFSNWEIGNGPNGGVLEMRVNANKPQGIKQTAISYDMVKTAKAKFSMGWSYSWFGISSGVSFDVNESVTQNTFKNHNAAGVSRIAKVDGAYMIKSGQHLSGSWDIDYYPHLGAKKAVDATVTIKFSAYTRTANKKVYGPITAYSTSPTKIKSL